MNPAPHVRLLMQRIKQLTIFFAAGFAAMISSGFDSHASAASLQEVQPVAVTVTDNTSSPELPSQFLGLSYEISMLLPKDGRYYFDPNNQALINTFKTLGIKCLRVGANAVDNPRTPIPQEKDIDEFFNFARAAGVKVIYSFRLKDGDPADSARLARYIMAHHSEVLDCFSIGNEPNFYFPTYEAFFEKWKPHYDAILKAVPKAMFDGPSVANNPPAARNSYPLDLAKAVYADGHLLMASDHYYFLGRRNDVEKDPSASRARFLSNDVDATYVTAYAQIGAKLAAQGVPYRIDELNSCARGGAKDSSDTYASTLWALDCTHWWATHHILGMNYHTGDSASYSAFVYRPDRDGFSMRPQAYAYLAFNQGAHGRPIGLKIETASAFNFTAYAYRDHDGSLYVTLINKSYGEGAQSALVSLQLHPGKELKTLRRMDLVQTNQEVAAKTGIMLGGGDIDSQGKWSGRWLAVKTGDFDNLKVEVAPASATLLYLSPVKMEPTPKLSFTSQ